PRASSVTSPRAISRLPNHWVSTGGSSAEPVICWATRSGLAIEAAPTAMRPSESRVTGFIMGVRLAGRHVGGVPTPQLVVDLCPRLRPRQHDVVPGALDGDVGDVRTDRRRPLPDL